MKKAIPKISTNKPNNKSTTDNKKGAKKPETPKAKNHPGEQKNNPLPPSKENQKTITGTTSQLRQTMAAAGNNSRFLLFFIAIITTIALGFLVAQSALLSGWIRENSIYHFVLIIVSLLPIVYLGKFGWLEGRYQAGSWVLFLSTLGIYYAHSAEPDFLGWIYDTIQGEHFLDNFFPVFWGTLRVAGLAGLFYFYLDYIQEKSASVSSTGESTEAVIQPKTYFWVILSYLGYLNALVSVVNGFFHRPF